MNSCCSVHIFAADCSLSVLLKVSFIGFSVFLEISPPQGSLPFSTNDTESKPITRFNHMDVVLPVPV